MLRYDAAERADPELVAEVCRCLAGQGAGRSSSEVVPYGGQAHLHLAG